MNKKITIALILAIGLGIFMTNSFGIVEAKKVDKYDSFYQKELKKIKNLNKDISNSKISNTGKKVLIKERNMIIKNTYNHMLKNNNYKYYSIKYGLDWEC